MLDHIAVPGADIPGISAAVAVRSGELVCFSGHVPQRPDGALETGPLAAQVAAAFASLERSMVAAGVARGDLVRLTLYVQGYTPEELPLIRAERDRHVEPSRPPASALIGVQSLFHPQVRVEIDALGVRAPGCGGTRPHG